MLNKGRGCLKYPPIITNFERFIMLQVREIRINETANLIKRHRFTTYININENFQCCIVNQYLLFKIDNWKNANISVTYLSSRAIKYCLSVLLNQLFLLINNCHP